MASIRAFAAIRPRKDLTERIAALPYDVYSREEAKKEVGMVIESIDNIDVAYELGKLHNIEMPIVETVYRVLYESLDPQEAVKDLMTRDKKME